MKENRVVLVPVPEHFILEIFTHFRMNGGALILPEMEGLPENYVIKGVNYDYSRACFMFRVYHESFDRVKPNHLIPVLDTGIKRNMVIIKNKKGEPFMEK